MICGAAHFEFSETRNGTGDQVTSKSKRRISPNAVEPENAQGDLDCNVGLNPVAAVYDTARVSVPGFRPVNLKRFLITSLEVVVIERTVSIVALYQAAAGRVVLSGRE